jgi:CRP/FNR family transcriptional regulator, anaerobic regulatory protein
VRCLPLSALHDMARFDAGLGLELYRAVSQELTAARKLLFTVNQRTACERLAGFLQALSERNARRGESASEIVLPMTRTDIADLLGLTIETVSRTFTKFRKDGLIDIEQCILVTIRDADTIAEIANGGGQSRA